MKQWIAETLTRIFNELCESILAGIFMLGVLAICLITFLALFFGITWLT